MLVALPSAIAFGATIFAPLGGGLAAQGALAGILGAMALGLIAAAAGGTPRLISAPCAPAAAVLSALAANYVGSGIEAPTVILMLGLIGLLAGLMQVALGMIGVGRLIRFIPFPVVSGYLSGVGLIIIGTQIPKLLGLPQGHLLDALQQPGAWDWRAMAIGSLVITAMVLAPRTTQRLPAAIVALISGLAGYALLALLDPTLRTTTANPLLIGDLSASDVGLFDSTLDHWRALGNLGLDAVVKVAVPAATLAVLLSIDTLKTCLVLDAMSSSQHDSNRELVGQGLGNFGSSLIGGIPGAGTMGASLVSLSSGAQTRRAGLIAGGLALFAYVALAPLIAWVPVAALAGILIVIGVRMIDQQSLRFFYSPATRFDFFVILSVILVALVGNLIAASGVGVALAILLFIREQTRSSIVRHRIEGSEIFAKRTLTNSFGAFVRAPPAIGAANDTIVIELQGSLFFGTASQLHKELEQEIGRRRYVILSMRRVQSLDVTATHVLEQIKDRLEKHDAYLIFCDIPRHLPSGLKMKRFLKETGVVRPTNKAFAFRHQTEALEWVELQHAALSGRVVEKRTTSVLSLTDMPVFAKQADPALDALQSRIKTIEIKAGKRVFKAGSSSDALYIIRRGTVKITVPLGKKDDYHLATCGPGDIIGGVNFLVGSGHTADALALEDVEVYELTRDLFDGLSAQFPALALELTKQLARNLSHRLQVAIAEVQALRD
jgi:SulP family sulfate permease